MGLKILHSADWHLDAPFTSFLGEQREYLHQMQRTLPGKIVEICRQENCDLVLLAGDIFDGVPSRAAIDAVKRALAACDAPVFITPGNHDYCEAGSVWREETWPENVIIFTGDMETVSIPELDCRIWGAGYRSMDCEALLEGFRAEGTETYQIGVLHGDPVTSRSPYCPITAAQIRDSGLTYLALGHIHKSGILRAGSVVCGWPGCPMGRGWDETEEKGIFIVELEQNVNVRFLPLDMPRFHDMTVDVTEGADAALDAILPAGGSADFYRITLTGQMEEDLYKLEQQYIRFPNLFWRDETELPTAIWEDADSDTLRGTYFRLLREQAEENPRALLAAEISRKILTGREVRLP